MFPPPPPKAPSKPTARNLGALLAMAVLVAACSSTPDYSTWCDGYREWGEALVSYDLAEHGSADAAEAMERGQNALGVLYVIAPPAPIAADYEVAIAGPNPADRGEKWVAAADRVVGWAIANCDSPQDFIELLRTE